MFRALLSKICTALVASSEYMVQGLYSGATGRLGITPLLMVIWALRQISNGLPSDIRNEYSIYPKRQALYGYRDSETC